MIVLGCDIGSIFTKAVIMDDDKLLSYKIIRTTGNIEEEVKDLLNGLARDAGIDEDKVECLAGTGSGAEFLRGADFLENIISCLGCASGYYLPEVQLSIDIGGQSITSIVLNKEGEIENFMRNDKCASGSGRFLEMMSDKLKVKMSDIDEMVAKATRALDLSMQCGVFAESEVISYVNQGEDIPNIISGVCATVANMVIAQAKKIATAEYYTLTGGVSSVGAVVRKISEKLNSKFLQFPYHPQLAGAIGAALLAGSE